MAPETRSDSLSPFLRGEGWGEGRSSTRTVVPLTPTLSAEVGYIRLRPIIMTELGYTRVRLPQERGEGAARCLLHCSCINFSGTYSSRTSAAREPFPQ